MHIFIFGYISSWISADLHQKHFEVPAGRLPVGDDPTL